MRAILKKYAILLSMIGSLIVALPVGAEIFNVVDDKWEAVDANTRSRLVALLAQLERDCKPGVTIAVCEYKDQILLQLKQLDGKSS